MWKELSIESLNETWCCVGRHYAAELLDHIVIGGAGFTAYRIYATSFASVIGQPLIFPYCSCAVSGDEVGVWRGRRCRLQRSAKPSAAAFRPQATRQLLGIIFDRGGGVGKFTVVARAVADLVTTDQGYLCQLVPFHHGFKGYSGYRT